MIRFFLFLLLIQINNSFLFGQKLEYGTYKSTKGSILKINNNNTFYFKKQDIFHTDIIAVDLISFSDGIYNQRDNFLVLNSKPYDSINTMIQTNEVINKNKKIDSSINIKLTTNNDEIKTFICGTGLENIYNSNDYGGCFLLKEGINEVKLFHSENFHIRIYPNIESPRFRTKIDNINTFFFQSKSLKKSITSGLDVNIDFDTQNFLRIFFNEEIAIIKGDIIRFLGEDLILQK